MTFVLNSVRWSQLKHCSAERTYNGNRKYSPLLYFWLFLCSTAELTNGRFLGEILATVTKVGTPGKLLFLEQDTILECKTCKSDEGYPECFGYFSPSLNRTEQVD